MVLGHRSHWNQWKQIESSQNGVAIHLVATTLISMTLTLGVIRPNTHRVHIFTIPTPSLFERAQAVSYRYSCRRRSCRIRPNTCRSSLVRPPHSPYSYCCKLQHKHQPFKDCLHVAFFSPLFSPFFCCVFHCIFGFHRIKWRYEKRNQNCKE